MGVKPIDLGWGSSRCMMTVGLWMRVMSEIAGLEKYVCGQCYICQLKAHVKELEAKLDQLEKEKELRERATGL